ncbi:MAG: diaminobutyrate--2-oxoglutarate transaminase, partial [Gemmataceae bacterium]|nr:diaminobutyrate--2-oxoglutarate transaminase [Gemmataceae bacterium]
MTAHRPDFPSRYYLDRQQAYESNARTYPRRLPIAIRKAKGLYLTDADGKTYMDCLAGAGTLALGHNHPAVVEAIRTHLDEGYPLHTLDLTSPVKDAFVEELFATLPKEFASRAKVHFCGPSGADAVEAAVKLVKTATGRRSILAFQGGYHGQTHGTLAMMGNLGPKAPVTGLMPEVHFLPYPYEFRCPPGVTAYDPRHGAAHIEYLLDDPESGIAPPAGMVLEAVQGEGGSIPAPDGWLRDIRRITRERGIPLVIDEIQTGWGRTGKMYAFEHSGIVPDVLVLSKAIGGSLPLAVIVYDQALDVWKPGAHTGTFRGNQLAMAAGIATLKYIQQHDIPGHAERMGRRLRAKLEAMQGGFPFLGDVRGRGLMIGVEVVDPAKTDRWGKPPFDGATARRIQQECFARGLIIEVGGRNGSVLRFLPPLIVTEAAVDAIADVVAAACRAVAGEPGVT